MNAENLLVSAIVAEEDLRPVLEAKVTPEFFMNAEDREAFEFILEFYAQYGETPGSKALKNNLPTYKLKRGVEPYEYYLDEVRRRRKFGLFFEMISEAGDALEEDDLEETERVLSAGLTRALTEVSELRDTNIIDTWEERLKTYAEWKLYGDQLKGIPSGFPTLDDALRGFQEKQLITFIGAPKAGKSTMMLKMAIAAHDSGAVPLFIGFEMSNEEQQARHDSMVAEVSYPRLLKGRLDSKEEKILRRALERRKSAHPFIFSSDPDGATVSGVAAKIDQYKPDILFIDGVYMMEDEEGEPRGTPQALTNITRSLKKLAQRRNIPVIIATQVLSWKINRRKGVDENSIGYSSSFAQDSDAILSVEHNNPEDETDPIKKVKIVIARSAPPGVSSLISWDWESGTFRELTYDEDAGGYGVEEDAEVEIEEEEDVTEDTWDPKRRVVRRKPRRIA